MKNNGKGFILNNARKLADLMIMRDCDFIKAFDIALPLSISETVQHCCLTNQLFIRIHNLLLCVSLCVCIWGGGLYNSLWELNLYNKDHKKSDLIKAFDGV